MTQTRKTTKKTAPKRDAYDDFLGMIEAKETPKKSQGTAASGKKTAGAKKTGSAARKKPAQVEPGIVALEGKRQAASEAKSKSVKTVQKAEKPAPKATVQKATEKSSAKSALRKEASVRKETGKGVSKSNSAAKKTTASGKKQTARPVETGIQRKPAGTQPRKAPAADVRKKAAGSVVQQPRKKVPAAAKKSGKSAVLYVNNHSGRDAYDEFLEIAEPKRAARTSKNKRRTKSGATAVLAAAILCMLGLGLWQETRYWNFRQMKNAVARQTFYEGTTVEGIDISTMTLQQALDYWTQQVEPKYAQRAVTLSNGMVFTSGELGYSSDYATVLTNAWSAGRSGSLEERYQLISNRQNTPVEYAVTRRAYSEDGVNACVAGIAAQLDKPAQNAHIESFDLENYSFVFADGEAGSKVDTEALRSGMTRALDAGGGTVELEVEAIQPTQKKEDIAAKYGMITSAITNASSSNKNRLTNIRQAMKLINGTRLAPGETFSFNETVGKRTTERGFKVATAYSSGEVTEEVGGGICQVSTTLFNAAVKADLEIVERHNHSLTVGYVDKGKDAAVNWNSQDLRFRNTTDDDIYICCYLTEDKRVRVGIFGLLIENGETITVEGVTNDTIPYETTYQMSFDLLPGQTSVVREGKNGYTASAYKIRWDSNGNQISKELLCKSRYKAVNAIIAHGPE